MRDVQRGQGPEARHKALAAVAQQVADLARSAMAQLGASGDMAIALCERCHDMNKHSSACLRPNRTQLELLPCGLGPFSYIWLPHPL